MPLWEYEDRDAYRERRTRRFGRQATQSAFRRLASGELRRRGYDPSVVPSLYRPISDQPQQPRDEVSGSRQVQYLNNIQKYVREGMSPENAVARAKIGATGGKTFATKGGEWTPRGQQALSSGEVSGDEPVEELVRGGYITPETVTGDVVDPRTVMPEALVRAGQFQRRFADPVAAAGLQFIESPAADVLSAGPAAPFAVAEAGLRELGVPTPPMSPLSSIKEGEAALRRVGVPKDVNPLPRRRTFGESYKGGPVNPITAAFGNDQEMENAQQVLEEAGLVRSIAAQLIFDPLNLLPVVGFTHFDDLGKLTRAAIRSSGATREAVMGAIKGNRAFRAAVEAGEAGRGRLGGRAVEEGALGSIPSEGGAMLETSYRGVGDFGKRGPGDRTMHGTEGRGLYVTKDKELASFFGGVEEVRHLPPRNPLVVDEEPLYLLQESEEIFKPIRRGDSEWTQINKAAVRRAGATERNWGRTQSLVGDLISEDVLARGHDAIRVTSGGQTWDVLLDPKLTPGIHQEPFVKGLEAPARSPEELARQTINAAQEAPPRLVPAEGSDLLLPRGYSPTTSTPTPGIDTTYIRRVGNVDLSVTRRYPMAEERMTLGGREMVRPAIEDSISVDIVRPMGREPAVSDLRAVLDELDSIARANPDLPVRSTVTNDKLVRLLENRGMTGTPVGTSGAKSFTFSPEDIEGLRVSPFQPTPASERIRAQVAAEGGEPPKLPPGGGDIGDGGVPVPSLIPGGRGPSKSMWRDIENAVTFGDVGRATVEALSKVPGMRPLIRVLTSPSALARIDPAARAAVVYRRVESIQIGELSQRMADLEHRFSGLWDEVGAPGTVRLADGTDVPFGDLATDVLADGSGFPVTSTQRQWILDSKRLIDDLAGQYEAVTGEAIALEGADYWPRFTLDDQGRAYVKGRVGAKQSPVKKRLYQEQEDGIAAGVPYASPLESVHLYGQSVQKMVRDDLLKKVVLEDKIGKSLTITEGHRKAITNTRAAIKRLEEGGLELQNLGEYQRLSKKLERLVEARAKIGAAPPHKGRVIGTALGPAFQRMTFERQTLKTIQDIVGPGPLGKPGQVLRASTYAAGVPRFVVTGIADVGHFFIQGLPLLASDMVTHSGSWARAVGDSVRSMADPQYFRKWLTENPDAQLAIRYGGDMGGTEFTEVTRRSHILRRLPGAKQAATILGTFPRGFEAFIAAGKGYSISNMIKTAAKAGAGESEFYRIANYGNTKLGTTNLLGLGLSTTQRQVESAFVFYSSRYTRSLFGMVGWMFSKGVPASDARKSIAGMLFAGALGYYGFARAAGLSHDEAVSRLNPVGVKSSKFMSIPVGGNEYGIGSGYRATLGFLGSLLQHDNWEFDSWEDAAKDNPMVRYLRSRTSPTTGTLIDFIEGEDFMGRQVSVDDFMDDPSRLLDYSQDKFLPLNIEAVVEARGPTWQKLLAGGVETAGGRAFPRSSFELFQESQEREFQRLRSLGEAPYLNYSSYAQLREADTPAAEAIDESSAVVDAQERMERENRYRAQAPEQVGFKKLEETRQAQQNEQQADDTMFSGGTMPPDTWQDNLRFRQREYFARRDEIIKDFGLTFKEGTAPPHSVNAAIEDYFSVDVKDHTNPMTNQTDWSAFFAAREASMSGLALKDRLRVVAYTRRYDTPTVLQFKQAQDTLRPYFNVLTDVWTRMREHPDLARYSSYDSWLTAQAEELTRLGVPANELQMRLSDLPAVSRIESAVGELRARYRIANPDADATLVKWYGLIPIRMQIGSSDGRSRRRSRRRESAVERSR